MTTKLPNREDRRAYSGYKHDDSKVIKQIQAANQRVPKSRKIKSMINKPTHKEVYETQELASSSTARLELKYNSYDSNRCAGLIHSKLQSKTMLTRRNVFLFVIFCSSVSLQLKHMQQPWQALLFSIIALYAISLSVTYGTYLSCRAIGSLLVIIYTKALGAMRGKESQDNNRNSPTTNSPNARRNFRLSWLHWDTRGVGRVRDKAKRVEISNLETNSIAVFQYRHFWWMAVLFTVLVPTMILCIDCTAENQQQQQQQPLLQSSSQDIAHLSKRALITPENDRVLDGKATDYKLPAKSKPTLANFSSERDSITNEGTSYDIELDDKEGQPKVRRSRQVSANTKNKRRIGRMTGSKSKLEPEDESSAQATVPDSFAPEPSLPNASNQEDDQICTNCNTDDQPLRPAPQPSSHSGARMHRRAPLPDENNHVTSRLMTHKRPVIGAAPYVLPSFSPKPQSTRNNLARSPITNTKYSSIDNLSALQPMQLLDISQQHRTRRVANSRPKFYNNYEETGAQASIPTTSTLEPTWSNLQVQKDEYQPVQAPQLCIGCANDDQQQQQQQQQQPFIPQAQSQNIALLSRKNYPQPESNQQANRFMTFGMPILAASPYVPTNFTSLAHLNTNPSRYSRVFNNRLGNNYNNNNNNNNNNHNILQPLQLANAAPYLHRIGRVANSKSKNQPNYDETGAQASVLTTSTSDPTWSSSQNQEDDYQQSPQTIQITAVPNGGFVGNGFNGLNGLNGFGGFGGLAGLNALNGWGGGPWNGRQVLLVNRQPQVGTGMEWRSWMLPVAIILALPLILGALFVPMFLKSVMLLIQILQMLGLLMPPSQLAAHLTTGSHNQQSG